MRDYELVRLIADERLRRIERHLQARQFEPAEAAPSGVRRAFGRKLIQIGSVLAADGQFEPAPR